MSAFSPRVRPLLLLGALLAAGACYEDPQKQLDEMQQMMDLGDALNELVMRTGDLQVTVDSLRAVIAKQDTALVRIANVTGVPYTR